MIGGRVTGPACDAWPDTRRRGAWHPAGDDVAMRSGVVTPFVPKMVSSANRLESFRDALEEQRTTESHTRVCCDPGARKDDLKVFETLAPKFRNGSLTHTKWEMNVRALDIVLDVPRTPGAPLKSWRTGIGPSVIWLPAGAGPGAA